MKKLILIFTLAFLTGCSMFGPKKEDLKTSGTCTVYSDGPLGSVNYAEVHNELAQQKITCWVMNMYLCSYTDYKFRNSGSNEVVSSLPPADKTIAKLEGNTLTVHIGGIEVEPFEIKNGKATYSYKGLGPVQTKTVEYNGACSTRQAALGLLTIIAK